MLTRLHLINFRRHADTELLFSSDAQIVAITGANGVGKSSILEALTYALYGEGRQGRRNLSRLVRRGAEFEGMQVEVEFHVDDVAYDLVRRLEKGKTSATLTSNGSLIMQSADGVTAEVTKILGMDAAGFRLAVIAQQFDVDALAELTPTRRRQAITRLLRQDAITRAKVAAADEKNRQLDVLRAFGEGPDLDALNAELVAANDEVAAIEVAVAESVAALASLDASLADAAKVRLQWQEAQVALARVDAARTAALAEHDRVSAELVSIFVPERPAEPTQPLAKVVADLSVVNIALANARRDQELAAVAEQTRAELVTVRAALADVEKRLAGRTPAGMAMAATTAQVAAAQAAAALEDLRAQIATATAERAEPAGELAALAARARKAAMLGEVCDTCEQPITAQHRAQAAAQRAEREQELRAQLSVLDAAAADLSVAVKAAEAAVADARTQAATAAAQRELVAATLRERTDLERRVSTYEERLARIQVQDVDTGELEDRKTALHLAKVAGEQYEEVLRTRLVAMERKEAVSRTVQEVASRLADLNVQLELARPAADLEAAHAALVDLEAARQDEQLMLDAVRADGAKASARVLAARARLAGAHEQVERVRTYRAGADRAAKTARLLDVTAERMATQIRPALQSAISDRLNQLSEGRFTQVELSDSYDVTVLDDGKFEPLSELSGGERILVALATRLALAGVVSGRHASARGVGLLVLDEVFGSQDSERREAIMAALRALRGEYGQILLISHVGGLEEAADHVVDVSAQVVEGVRVADVAVA